ncbi:DUF3592 domain-containing protein [Streptomyces sp. NPDC051132]|uniref:DUF3592 domain-containing protein n=1 Tax=unclassified Streptomyces TaxID=2593676 RepID=UPI003429C7D2
MRVRVRGQAAHRWIVFGLTAFGGLFLVLGLVFAGVSVSYLTDAERARGTVVDLEWRTDHGHSAGRRRGDDDPVAYAVVAFTSADGTRRTFEDSGGSNPPAYEKGEQVEVLYRADSPEDARINGFFSLWLLPLIFGGAGLLIMTAGAVVAVVARRRRPRVR